MFTNVHISYIMITLPLIEKKGIPRQYFAALDHLNGGLYVFLGNKVNMKKWLNL